MAYKTSHRLKIDHPLHFIKGNVVEGSRLGEIASYIQKNEDMDWALSEGLNVWGEDDRSFENADKNMKNLSLAFPNLLFILEYDPIRGFELGAHREYWFRGKVQRERALIKINAFDFNELEEVE